MSAASAPGSSMPAPVVDLNQPIYQILMKCMGGTIREKEYGILLLLRNMHIIESEFQRVNNYTIDLHPIKSESVDINNESVAAGASKISNQNEDNLANSIHDKYYQQSKMDELYNTVYYVTTRGLMITAGVGLAYLYFK